jgi:uncharacterized membrane protein
MLVGVLGGPLGMLLGFGAGVVVGGSYDLGQADQTDDAITMLGRAIPPGSTAVIASVSEPATEIIDAEMLKLSGEVTRQRAGEVLSELEAAQQAADAAAKEARRTMMEQRKAKASDDFGERVGKLKQKMHIG